MSEADYLAWAAKQHAYSFVRQEMRKRRFDFFRADCGHKVGKSERYRYQVWRINSEPRGQINQRTDCEPCVKEERTNA